MENEFKKIMAVMLKTSPDFDDIARESTPIWDSMKHAEIIIKLQNAFGVKFDLAEIMQINKASELYQLIEKKKLGRVT